ncbi:hypothetical protein JCM8202_000002 [Rhodotorula sphaerocarpa]
MAKLSSASPRRATPDGSWSPSPSPSPPSSPRIVDLDSLSDRDRIRLLQQRGPMRPSELGLPAGNARSDKGGGKGGAGKESGGPTVVLSPEELEKLVERQQQGETPADVLRDLRDSDEDDEDLCGPPSPHAEEESALWEDVANAVLWTIPFGFLFCGMDYAVHRQFGEWLSPAQEFLRLLNFLPALFILNLFLTLSPSRSPLPPPSSPVVQSLLSLLSVTTGLLTIRTTTEEGYLRVIARAPALGVLWCWTAVRLDLGWALMSLAGVGVGLWATGADVSWLKSLA